MRLPIGLGLFLLAPAVTHAQTPSSVEFPVTAEIERAPDRADFQAGVVTQAPTAAEASRLNAERMTRVIAAIARTGLPERDVQTTGVTLQPQYDYSQQGKAPRLAGYQATNMVRIRLRDLERAGAVLDSLVVAGANQVNGPDFGLIDEDAALDAARRAAVAKARARAELYASALGRSVGRIAQLTEGVDIRRPPPMPMMRMQVADASAESTPVAPGRLTLSVTLNVRVELGDQAR